MLRSFGKNLFNGEAVCLGKGAYFFCRPARDAFDGIDVKMFFQHADNHLRLAFSFALGFACLSSPDSVGGNEAVCMFVSYLLSIAVFGLFQAVFMADAGGAWDNAKKIVEVDLQAKGTPLHEASVVGDTVGDPYKDTCSVALNPIIKFTTLFGVLAMEIAISDSFRAIAPWVGVVFVLIALYFVYRSFFNMKSQDDVKE